MSVAGILGAILSLLVIALPFILIGIGALVVVAVIVVAVILIIKLANKKKITANIDVNVEDKKENTEE